jgi:hypothetical protein
MMVVLGVVVGWFVGIALSLLFMAGATRKETPR